MAAPTSTLPPGAIGHSLSRGRRIRNRLAESGMVLALLLAAVPLGAIVVVLFVKGFSLVTAVDWWTKPIPTNVASNALSSQAAQDAFGNTGAASTQSVVYGMQPAIVGTIMITGLAALMAIPLGVAAAVYLNEYGGSGRVASVIRFFTDVMTGVPSVVMGIFIYTIWVLNFGSSGRSAFAGGLALACLMLPVVVRSTEEMLRLVPDTLRQASAALGTPKWRTTMSVVIPAALPGITSGAMLAVARAAGETAPILFTVGIVTSTNWSIFGQNTTLSQQIYQNATQPGGESIAWAAALTLIVIVVVLTVSARFVTSKFSVRVDG